MTKECLTAILGSLFDDVETLEAELRALEALTRIKREELETKRGRALQLDILLGECK